MNVMTTFKSLAIATAVTIAMPSALSAQTTSTTSIDEDFSLFTSGSEDSPSSAINSEDGTIPSNYFHQSGWTGFGVHQAGGACALINPDNYGAQLNTATGNYAGTYVVTVRAKTLASNSSNNARLNIGLWQEADNQYNQTSYYEHFVTSKTEWREFTYTFNNTDFTQSNRMLIAFYTDGNVLIDDVHIYKPETLQAPTPLGATDFKTDGFTANWMPVENATHYLFSLFHNVTNPVTEETSFSESFASLKDGGSMPEGWTYTSQDGSKPEFYSNDKEKVASAVRFKTGDVIEMPDNGGTYTSLSFSILEVKMPRNIEDLWGTEIHVDLWNGFAWTNFTTIQVDASEYGEQFEHEIDWTRFIKQDKNKCTKIRFRLSGMPDDCAFGLTNFKWSTKTSSNQVYDIRDQRVDGTFFTTSGLDPETDYFYTVKACNDNMTSASSNAMEADGLPAPVAEAATDVNHDSYTANWQPVAKATGYTVDNFDVYVAPKDEDSYVVINEDFSKIADTGVTIEKPFAFQNSSYQKLGSNMVYREGWQCIWGGYADGCFVGTGMTDYNISGVLLTPELTLSNDEGRYHVRLTARSMLKSDDMIVYGNAGTGVSCTLSPDEWRTFDIDLTGGQLNDVVAFTTANHYPFIIDDIKITQNLKKDDRVYELLSTSSTIDADETQYTVSQLSQPAANHTYAFAVKAIRQRQTSQTTSGRSNIEMVDGFLSAINNTTVASPSARETARFTPDGMKANAQTKGLVIVKFSDGRVKKYVQK